MLSGEIDLAGVERLHGDGEFEAEAGGVEQLAIGDHEADAFDALAFEVGLRRGEAGGIDADAGDLALVQIRGQFAAADEIGADLLERRVGAAADGQFFEHSIRHSPG